MKFRPMMANILPDCWAVEQPTQCRVNVVAWICPRLWQALQAMSYDCPSKTGFASSDNFVQRESTRPIPS